MYFYRLSAGKYAETRRLFEVYNREDEKLWSIPVADLETISSNERKRGYSVTTIADLNSDDMNEIIISIQLPSTIQKGTDIIHIFRADKSLLREIKIGEPSHHGMRE